MEGLMFAFAKMYLFNRTRETFVVRMNLYGSELTQQKDIERFLNHICNAYDIQSHFRLSIRFCAYMMFISRIIIEEIGESTLKYTRTASRSNRVCFYSFIHSFSCYS